MRAGNREVNIFNMSLLDILCGALGAFCFMMIALLPHYAKASKAGTGMSESEKQQLEAKRNYEPLAVQMWWFEPGPDIDMYITRPGKDRQPERPTVSKTQAPLIIGDVSTGCKRGPCSEAWLLRELPPGTEAQLYFKLMTTNGVEKPVRITSRYMYQNESKELPDAEVSPQKPITHVGKFQVAADGSVQFRPSNDTYQLMNKVLQETKQQLSGGNKQ